MARRSLSWLLQAAALATLVTGVHADDRAEAVCLREEVGPEDVQSLTSEAIRVLQACGRDPAAYRLELRGDDASPVARRPRASKWVAAFEPLDPARQPALEIGPADPCVVSWSWKPEQFTEWQIRALERARAYARQKETRWEADADDVELRVTETRDHLGIRWWSASGAELRVVLRKSDLEPESAAAREAR